MRPEALHSWLTRVLYNRRSRFDPLWNTFVVGGMQEDKPFLGFVDKLGTAYTEDHIATGMGSQIAVPIMRYPTPWTLSNHVVLIRFTPFQRALGVQASI